MSTFKRAAAVLAISVACAIYAQAINLVPMPTITEENGETVEFSGKRLSLKADNGLEKTAHTWMESIRKQYPPGISETTDGYTRIVSGTILPEVKIVDGRKAEIRLSIDGNLPEEGYVMDINREGISIAGGSEKGVWWGLQSLTQLMIQGAASDNGKIELPHVHIEDSPHFAYRGALLDCCRYFFKPEDVKKFIDMMALHKLNTFHWHLTNDQGWRIEIKKYPRLTEIGSMRAETKIGHANDPTFGYDGIPHGGYYTQEEIKDIVQYAADRQITVIPEIEMPGHALAALASYQYLGCRGEGYKVRTTWNISDEVFCVGRETTFEFLEDVLDEVCELFPSEYIHIGGDECPTTYWQTCPDCQRRMKEEGLEDERQLQGYLLKRIEKYLNAKGRKIIGWDEILEGGVTPTAVVMSWRGSEGGIEAAKKGNKVIMTPNSYFYLNYYQTTDPGKYGEPLNIGGCVPIQKTYSFDPYDQLDDEEKQYITGIQACVWGEYISTMDKAQFMALPRLAAVAEVAWSPKKSSYDEFFSRVKASMKPLYEYFGLIYAPYAFEEPERYTMWYDQPAPNGGIELKAVQNMTPSDSDWERWSLPIGNGYMGASIFGRTETERIQLSEKTFCKKGLWGLSSFSNFAEIYLDFYHYSPRNYRRELSLDNAIATVKYDYDGVKYCREYFANYPSNVIVVNIKADKPGKVDFTLRPVLPYLRESDEEGLGRTGRVYAEDNLITMSGKVPYYDLAYEAQIKVIPAGGAIYASNDGDGDHGMIQVCGADSVSLLIMAKTSYLLNENVFLLPDHEKIAGNPHPHDALTANMDMAVAKGPDSLKAEHLKDYRNLFSRVSLKLTDKIPDIPTDRLLADYKKGEYSTYLDELVFQYGRYLLISSSRKGTLPANLQGTWTQYETSPWTGGYWHNINVQMNYWPAFVTDLPETFYAYAAYNEAFRKKAQLLATDYIRENNPSAVSENLEENGWIIGTGGSVFAISGPGGHSGPGTGGFTTKLFWEWYDFTRDENILRLHTYPAIIGMARFYSKMLKPMGNGQFLTDPSSSPEQQVNNRNYITVGCTFDQSMIEDNYRDVLKAAEILNDKSPLLDTIRYQLPKLDPILVGTSGQIKEFREEQAYGDIGEYNHRHISHLVGLYPGSLINSNTPEWLDAAKVSLEKRGDKSTGWATAHRLNAWARTKEGNRTYQVYQTFLKNAVAQNLWCLHPPFQIDGNFGATSGVAEMLLQSHEGYIEPLPALPDAWAEGSYSGLVARGNFSVSAKWSGKKIKSLEILSRKGTECVVKYENIGAASVYDSAGKKVRAKAEGNDKLRFKTSQGEWYSIVF